MALTLTVDGERLTLESLTTQGPAVLIFFRFAGCPACNIALPYYRDALAPALARRSVILVDPTTEARVLAGKVTHSIQ